MRRFLTALACAAALVAPIGCGESDEEQAQEAVEDYVEARNEGDFERECELYSEEFKMDFGIGEDCPAFLQEQRSGESPGKLEIVDVRVLEDRANADIDLVREARGSDRVKLILERQDDDWKITGLQ
jgi:hypothetical protein